MLKIRKALINDIEGITDIYNEAILRTNSTFDTVEKSLEEQISWFKNHGPKNPIIVAEDNDLILGWAALSKYDKKCAYSDSAEISLYVKEEFQNQGIGKKLLYEIIKQGEKADIHSIIARITAGNNISIKLHESVGFKVIGVMKEIGYKFGKRLDVYLMQKIYKKL
jgi:phosphinothricin acetyltransferase